MISLDYWDKATRALSKHDPVMKEIIATYKGEKLASRGEAFTTLARAIAGQQISVKAAQTIWDRVEALLPKMTPKHMLVATPEDLRACGLSQQKITYLKHIAEFFHGRDLAQWPGMSDEELIEELIGIKGVGRWTAEMFLIFHLCRPDVFPIADIGVLKAIYKHYNKGEKMTKEAIHELAETWRPYRTVATWYLWRSLDPIPVAY